jgi:putative flippase GtrA
MLVALARQFVSYVSVGFAALVFHYGTLIALVETGTLGPDLAALAGFVVGGVVSYVLNRRYTFDSDRSHAAAGPRFAVTAAVGFVMTYLLMHGMTERLGIHYLLAQLVTTGIVLIWTFLGNRFWTFRGAARG